MNPRRRFTEWTCPGCGTTVKVRGATEIVHQCPRRNHRLTTFTRTRTHVSAA